MSLTKEKMIRFRCKRRCWGFRGTIWEEGSVVDVTESELDRLPHHFEPVDPNYVRPVPVVEKEKPIALSEMAEAGAKSVGYGQSITQESLDRRTLKPRGRPKKA